jgi:hypothetical protein
MHVSVLRTAVLLLLISIRLSIEGPNARFPLQFSANVEITSHLIDESSEFPPRLRKWTVYYDYIAKKARADIEAGYEAAKYYIRRYDLKSEYMIRLDPISDCKRSYLGETMPFPDISDSKFIRQEEVRSTLCNYYLHEDFNSRVHIYTDAATGAPVRLIEENSDKDVSTPLLTYEYTDVVLGPPSSDWFELPSHYDRSNCVRHVGGFPYLHIFHYFVRF